MAKRRKETDLEEDKPFKLPKFNEEEFLRRERRNIKTTFLAFGFGLLMSFICFGFWALMGHQDSLRWPLVFLVAVVNSVFLKPIFLRFNIDLKDFTRKNWFSSYMVYFFTWLIFFIVIVNPPFYDDEAPLIELVIMPQIQEPGGDIFILAKITDNAGLEKKDITFTVDNIPKDDFKYIDNIFEYVYTGPNNITNDEIHNFSLTVKDHAGNINSKTDNFSFSKDAIYLALPETGSKVVAASDIKFGVKTNVFRVFYKVNDGQEINATQQADRKDYYITSPEYKGWVAGENISVKVSAELLYNFENNFLKDDQGNFILDSNNKPQPKWFVNYINDTSIYFFNVANESTIGQKESIEITRPTARIVAVPGFEMLVLLIALVTVILILKFRKKKRQHK